MNWSLNLIIIFMLLVNNLIRPSTQKFTLHVCSCILSTFVSSQKQEMRRINPQIS